MHSDKVGQVSPLVQAEKMKAGVRAKVEPFFYIKNGVHYNKARYRGLEKTQTGYEK